MAYCTQCGRGISDANSFCTGCGITLSPQAVRSGNRASQITSAVAKRSGWHWLGFFAFVIVSFVGLNQFGQHAQVSKSTSATDQQHTKVMAARQRQAAMNAYAAGAYTSKADAGQQYNAAASMNAPTFTDRMNAELDASSRRLQAEYEAGQRQQQADYDQMLAHSRGIAERNRVESEAAQAALLSHRENTINMMIDSHGNGSGYDSDGGYYQGNSNNYVRDESGGTLLCNANGQCTRQ